MDVDPNCSSLLCVWSYCRYELYSRVRWSWSVCTVLSLLLEDGRQPIPRWALDPEPCGHHYLDFHLLPAVQKENLLEDLEDEGRQECQRTLFLSSVLETKLKMFWRLQLGDTYQNSCHAPVMHFEFVMTILELKSTGSFPVSRFSNERVEEKSQNNVLWYYFICSAESWISTLILYHWLKSAGSQFLSILLSFTRLNSSVQFIVPISKWEVKGTLEEGEKAIWMFQVKMKPLEHFVVQWLLSALLALCFPLAEIYIWFSFKTTSPFPHSICEVTSYATCSQSWRRSESERPRGVH